jgi:hypothetical protein
LPLNEARLICSWLTVSGQLSVSSDSFADLPAERLDLLKRTMPSHGLRPRPVDLFEEAIPRIWLLTDTRVGVPRRDLVGLFNWSDKEAKIEQDVSRLGLSSRQGEEHVAFDYWSNKIVTFKDKLEVTLPPRSCAVWSVRPVVAKHPQVLSTSRHITQGIVDVLAEKWDGKAHTLAGTSRVVGGDRYELRICAKSTEWRTSGVSLEKTDADAGATASFKEEKGLVRVTIESAKSREVRWKLRFERAAKGKE